MRARRLTIGGLALCLAVSACGRSPSPEIDLERVAARHSDETRLAEAIRATAEELRRRGVRVTERDLKAFRERHRALCELAVDRRELEARRETTRLVLELVRDRYAHPEEWPATIRRAKADHAWLEDSQLEAMAADVDSAEAAEEMLAALSEAEFSPVEVLGGESRQLLLALGAFLGEHLSPPPATAASLSPEDLYRAVCRPRTATVFVYLYRDRKYRDDAFARLGRDPALDVEGTAGLLHVSQICFEPVSYRGVVPPWLLGVLASREGTWTSPPGEVGGPGAGEELGVELRGPAIAKLVSTEPRESVAPLAEWRETLLWLPDASRRLRAFAAWLSDALPESSDELPSLRLP
jgi:hypothetical protein